ncbi:4-hydroxy-tetrahydrodipicolinate synthase [Candidatus Omnitrophota bacterium]
MFKGAMVAIVTPFKDDGKSIDEKKFRELIEFHIENGTKAIVPCGTTGESATLSMREHEHIIEVAVDAAKGRVSILAGTGSNNTAEAIELTKYAEKVGVDGVLIITPYYNKPTQEGVYRHFKALSEAVKIPIVAYNIASRTGTNITPETMARISTLGNVVGVKEASGDLNQMAQMKALCKKGFCLISGDDSLTLPLLSIGGCGIVSVVANIIPKEVSNMVNAYLEGDTETANKLHYKMLPLVKAMFIETNPIPVKTAMGMMGMLDPVFRLPMCEMSDSGKDKLELVLKEYGLI